MAGLRKPQDELEAIGVDRAKATIDGADILVIVLDASAPLTDDDREIAANTGNAPRIVALNKVDLPLAVAEGDVRALFPNSPVCRTSALMGLGIEGLKDAIFNIISKDNSFEAGLNASARELFELQCAARTIAEAQEVIKTGLGQDLAASALATAGACLQRLLGKSYDDALLEAIFSRFCVGK
jgi:tRNA modification GTPase